MTRLEILASYIDAKDKVVDVGCDQANLSVILAKKGIKSIASDKRANIIEKARIKIKELGMNNAIDLRVSDGLLQIKEGEADTLVLAGMGTYTIIDILEKTELKFKKIITIANNNNEMLRRTMSEFFYKIKEEEIIFDKKKFYNLIVFVPGMKDYTEEEILLGINHRNLELFKKMNEEYIKKIDSVMGSHGVLGDDTKKIYDIIKSSLEGFEDDNK